MKIIQSYWTKPVLNGIMESESGRYSGGWLYEKTHSLSWIFSCLQLKKYYDKVELVTDKLGKEILIDQLKLPYTKVHVILDDLNEYHPDLWALGKIYSYSIQDEPFIHVDNDVYVWGAFSEKLHNARLVTQHFEKGYPFYENLYKNLKTNNVVFPEVILENRKVEEKIHAYNAGIIGGNDIAFFKNYSKEAFKFVDNNVDKLSNIDIGRFNTIFEQYLFYCLTQSQNIDVACYSDIVGEQKLDIFFQNLTRFKEAPKDAKFIHLYGEYCKKHKEFCDELENKVKTHYPEYYENVIPSKIKVTE
ncbi:DUF6734 family protein [uncultured Aquimarina sp.]|uniref:DUF6734 family protein n=1 Tax=uncultured Aquimarina sp. TaxID=575652 RepID=UPI00262B9A5E|nr:DUF6734 family protein [uncultured Aquimarina sp.]